ncbi:glycosyltransferase family 1 protein [Klebsiella huaxiensis]|uniref:Glycosyltransferase n=1 Tax=Klebsiella huaxiensis TaxID=2153354 RepID=A0ABT6EGL0_9ENTR|nr:glycosyltransferase [Klebsiella huaxiensis]MDG1644315.1 glycosyltransferase [Klebsiella huaxiensis]QBG07465.1 glycosyltransferase family 1 protein [Klebsiella huaxiensis]VUS54916.1 O-antigen biosynthesis glycosyltransferase WbnH [Klebsiella huaxiensis]
MIIFHVAEVIKGGVASVINELLREQSTDTDIKKVTCLIPDSQREELIADDDLLYTFKRTGRNIISLFRFFLKFVSILVREKPDIIHLHSTFAGFVCRFVLLLFPFVKVKVIYCPHAFSFMMKKNRAKVKIYAVVEQILSIKTNAIICVSNYERDKAIEVGLNKDKLKTIYNGVSEPSKSLIERPGCSELNVLYVGRFDFQKGFDILLDIIKLSAPNKGISFTIIGDFVSENESYSIASENAKFLGWLPKQEIYKYYRSSDVLLIPSRWEGLAMVPLEAFSCKLPVIASSCSSFPEIIDDHVNGFLVDMEQREDVVNLLLRLSTAEGKDKLKDMSTNAYETYHEKFSAEKMTLCVKKLYSSIYND